MAEAAAKQLQLLGTVPMINKPLSKRTIVDSGNWPNSTLYVLFGNFLVLPLMGSLTLISVALLFFFLHPSLTLSV